MTSYKCLQCGLVGWKTDQTCKRCNAPNTYLSQKNLGVNSPPVLVAARNDNQVIHQKQDLIQNVFDAISSAFQAVMPNDAANLTELEIAERNIRRAWKAGRIGISLTIGFTLQHYVENFSDSFTGWLTMTVQVLILLSGVNIALVYGVYRKSRICAAIMFCAAILSVLFDLTLFLTTRELLELGTLLFSIVFGYFYVRGFLGTLKYHRLVKP